MPKYIDAEKLDLDLKDGAFKVNGVYIPVGRAGKTFATVISAIKCVIQNAHAADVAPVRHGHWEFVNDYTGRCSVCKEEVDIDHLNEPAYCEKCGAKMDEEVEMP